MTAPIVDRDGRLKEEYDIKYGRLKVIEVLPNKSSRSNRRVRALCDCGKVFELDWGSVRSGHAKSCGCLRRETTKKNKFKHGCHKSPEYRVWRSLQDRCRNPKDHNYANYGGRGITVDPRWSDFETFLADVGLRPRGGKYSLDRIDNEKGYWPANVRWATYDEQNRNKRTNVWITIGTDKRCLADWAAELGMSQQTLCRQTKNAPEGRIAVVSRLLDDKRTRERNAAALANALRRIDELEAELAAIKAWSRP